MKTVFKRLAAALMSILVIAGISMTAYAGFGPNRPTKAWSPNVEGFDHVTFNSFTGVPNGIGDERDFLRGHQIGRSGGWVDPVQNVTSGAEVEAKIYIHNNADARLNDQPGNPGIARDVRVKVDLPEGMAKSQQTKAFISASNANPGEIYDTLDMTGADNSFFQLSYVPGSAKLIRGTTITSISDNLVTTGVNLGDQRGCFDYVQEVTFRVKVNTPNYNVKKQVRNEGGGSRDWKENVSINDGQKVDWAVSFTNTGATRLNGVKIVDEVPVGLTVVPGSIKLFNTNYPSGYTYGDSAIQANGRQINMDIGDYLPGADAVVTFKTTATLPQTVCGTKHLVNKAYATPNGLGAVWDDASVDVQGRTCVGPTYICKAVSIDQLGGRKIRVTVTPEMTGNVRVKHYTYDFGDRATALTDNRSQEHEYAADGTYTVKVSVTFVVDGRDQTVTSDLCAKTVTFTGGTVVPPTTLPATGAGDIFGIFAATSVAGAVAHKLFLARKFARL